MSKPNGTSLTLQPDAGRHFFPQLHFEEPIDEDRVKEAMLAPGVLENLIEWGPGQKGRWRSTQPQTLQLTKLSRKIEDGSVRVQYTFSQGGSVEWGRVYPEGHLSAGELHWELRAHLLGDTWTALDFENCHPRILEQALRKAGAELPRLKEYCDNRETWLEETQRTYRVDCDAAKQLFIRLLYGGQFKAWQQDHDVRPGAGPTPRISELVRELGEAHKTVTEANPALRDALQANDRAKKKRPVGRPRKVQKVDGTTAISTLASASDEQVLSYFCQEHERRLLRHFFDALREMGVVTRSDTGAFQAMLRYDGVDVQQRNLPLGDSRRALLNEVSDHIFRKSGFRMIVTEKAYPPADELASKIAEEANLKHLAPNATQQLNLGVLKDLKYYPAQKAYFERFITKVTQASCYAWVQVKHGDGASKPVATVVTRPKNVIIDTFDHIKSTTVGSGGEAQTVSFIKEWVRDENLSVHNDVCFAPFSEVEPVPPVVADNFNIFRGYAATRMPPVSVNDAGLDPALRAFHFIGLQLCEGDALKYQFFWRSLAHMVQRPRDRLDISFVFQNKAQGTGADVFFDAIGRVLGEIYYKNSSKVGDFFGDHAEGVVNKLLVVMNETELHDTKDHQSRIKDLITCRSTTVNAKHERPYEIAVYAFIVFVSNRRTAVHFDNNDNERRFVVFEPRSDCKSWSVWDTLAGDVFRRITFVRALYQDLISTDLTDFEPRRERRITFSHSYFDASHNNTTLVVKFFVSYIESLLEETVREAAVNDGSEQQLRVDQMLGAGRQPWEPEGMERLGTGPHEVRSPDLRQRFLDFCAEFTRHNPVTGRFVHDVDKVFGGLVREDKRHGTRYFVFYPRKLWNHMVEKRWAGKYSARYHDHTTRAERSSVNVEDRFVSLANLTADEVAKTVQ